MVKNSFDAFEILPIFSLYAMDRIKRLDDKVLMDLFERFVTIIVVKDNFRSGLFNAICQWAVEKMAPHRKVISISPEEAYDDVLGNSDYLESLHGLTLTK
jgi:transketolase C-terminal domain/subunit